MTFKKKTFIVYLDIFYWLLRLFYSKRVIDRAWMLQTFRGSDKIPPYCDTPDDKIKLMIAAAKTALKDIGDRPLLNYILEPEFGTGMMLKEIDAAFKKSYITGYEINPSFFAHTAAIYNKISSFGNNFVRLYNADFLKISSVKQKHQYNIIFMNPPYSGKEFIHHISHAIDMLDDNGVLIALLPESVFNSISVKSIRFREKLNQYDVQVDLLGATVCTYPVPVCMIKLINRPSGYSMMIKEKLKEIGSPAYF